MYLNGLGMLIADLSHFYFVRGGTMHCFCGLSIL